MRIIKFRVWNDRDSRPECRMIYDPTFTWNFKTIMDDGDEWDLPVMQFTGVLDKNGKEIFENDIVRFDVWENEQWYTIEAEITFHNGAFVLNSGHALYLADESVSIIGNRFQNPELLK